MTENTNDDVSIPLINIFSQILCLVGIICSSYFFIQSIFKNQSIFDSIKFGLLFFYCVSNLITFSKELLATNQKEVTTSPVLEALKFYRVYSEFVILITVFFLGILGCILYWSIFYPIASMPINPEYNVYNEITTICLYLTFCISSIEKELFIRLKKPKRWRAILITIYVVLGLAYLVLISINPSPNENVSF